MTIIRLILGVFATLVSLGTQAEISSPPKLDQPSVVTQTTQQPSEFTQLQAAGEKLSAALMMLQQQSNQLQLALSTLNQQVDQIQSEKSPLKTPENMQKLQQLRTEYLQIQDMLIALRQQEVLLLADMAKLNQQLLPVSTTPSEVAATTHALPAMVNTTSSVATDATTEISATATSPSTEETQQTSTSESSAEAPTLPTSSESSTTSKPEEEQQPNKQDITLTQTINAWIEDPAFLLRAGGGFATLALLLLLLLFWPKSKQKTNQDFSPDEKLIRSNPYLEPDKQVSLPEEENADLLPEYDFMNSQDAIPTRLDLARGYIEMGKYVEARAAIKPVLMKGNEAQKQEARCLLEKIELADMDV